MAFFCHRQNNTNLENHTGGKRSIWIIIIIQWRNTIFDDDILECARTHTYTEISSEATGIGWKLDIRIPFMYKTYGIASLVKWSKHSFGHVPHLSEKEGRKKYHKTSRHGLVHICLFAIKIKGFSPKLAIIDDTTHRFDGATNYNETINSSRNIAMELVWFLNKAMTEGKSIRANHYVGNCTIWITGFSLSLFRRYDLGVLLNYCISLSLSRL